MLAIDHPPRAERLREPEHRSAELARERPGGLGRIALDGDVHVRDRPPEQLVPQGASDDPGSAHRMYSRRTRGERPQVTS